jgi:arachidonate 15-lipoxygenase
MSETDDAQKPNVEGALSSLKRLLGERISDEAGYAFYYPSGFAVSNKVHSQDLPPVNWLGRVLERSGLEVIGPYLPHFIDKWLRPKTDEEEKAVDDAYVATSQVAGFNPLNLRRCEDRNYLTERFPSAFDWRFSDGDTFEAAFTDQRIFASDYSALNVIRPSTNTPDKRVYVPIGLFRIPRGEALEVIAIKVGQTVDDPVYRPGDPQWEQAKIAFNCADGNYHEIISHLGRTHLMIEPFTVSTARIFLEDHWVRRLIGPHICGTANINALAFALLINPGGGLDQLLCGDLTSELELSFDSIQTPGFRQLMLKPYLEERGLMDPRLLYPYRDDALLVWDAIRSWVHEFASFYCPNDQAVAGDIYIQNWVTDLTVGGKVSDLGEVNTLGDLVDVLTMIIFTASAQHAAVNYPQANQMQDARAVPLAIYGDVNTQPVNEILPPQNMRTLQKQVADLLAGVYFTKLGDYAIYGIHSYSAVTPTNHPNQALDFPSHHLVFTNGSELRALHDFREKLETVRAEIARRNETCPLRIRFPYWYLHPDNIPQSINI